VLSGLRVYLGTWANNQTCLRTPCSDCTWSSSRRQWAVAEASRSSTSVSRTVAIVAGPRAPAAVRAQGPPKHTSLVEFNQSSIGVCKEAVFIKQSSNGVQSELFGVCRGAVFRKQSSIRVQSEFVRERFFEHRVQTEFKQSSNGVQTEFNRSSNRVQTEFDFNF
jgi:hypothetical protein